MRQPLLFIESVELNDVLVLALVCASAVTDLRQRKIYNAFTYPAIVVGLFLSVLRGGDAIVSSTVACILGAAIFYPFYRAGGMGMGDLKLMAAIGALKGFAFWGAAMVDGALVGGILAVGVTLRHGTLLETLGRSVSVPWAMLTSMWTHRRPRIPRGRASATVPYGVAIGLGTVAAWLFRWPW